MRPNVTLSHRLLCFILLCVALCFSLIITNIFFDMDSFFSGWIKGHSEDIKYSQKPSENTYKRKKDIINQLFELNDKEEENVDDNYEQLFRNKRSIDFRNGIFPMGTPKNKNVIKKRLNKILEQLEEDDNKKAKEIEGVRRREFNKIKNVDNTNNDEEPKGVKNLFSQSYIADKIDMNLQNWSTTIHNAIANTLIQDTLQQMDLKDFFASINNLIKKEEKKKDGTTINVQAKIEVVNNKHNLVETDKEVNPQYLKQMVEELNKKSGNAKADEITEKYLETTQNNNVMPTRSVESDMLQIEDCPMIRKHKLYLHKMLEDYLRKFPYSLNNTKNTEAYTNKRVKRETNAVNRRDNFENINNSIKKDNDGLYIEIKTHVDEKRIKDKNKQKIVNNLIAKIERAIYSENELPKEKKKKVTRKHLHIRKRAQHPLNDKTKRESNYNKVSPYSSILPRQLDPIGLAGPKYSNFPSENEGMNLKPELKKGQESDVNRPQKSELIIDSKTIPQRRQMPLVHEELPDGKYFVKNFDGTGFSIGFNQYADEPPDEDSIKLFTGIENLIKEYHRNYDVTDSSSDADYANTNPGLIERFVNVRNKRHIPLSKYYNKKSNNLELRKNYPYRKTLNNYETEAMKKHLIIDKIIPQYLKETLKYKRLKKALERFLQRKSGYLRPKNLTESKTNKHSNSFVNKYKYLNAKREKRNTSKLGLLLNDFNEGNSSPFNSSDEAVIIYSDGNLPDSISMSDLDFQSNSSQIFSNEHFNDISTSFLGLEGTEIGRYESVNSGKKVGTPPEEDALMSKYPHILGSDTTTSNEDTYKVKEIQSEDNHTILHTHMTGVDEIIDALLPRNIQKTKYNVTVKLTPTDSTKIPADIKEVRSTINKTHNTIGLKHTSILNMSRTKQNNNTDATITSKSDIQNSKKLDLNVHNNEKSENKKIIPLMLEKQKQNIETQINYLKQEKLHIEKMMHEKNQSELENNNSDTVEGKRLRSHSTTEANEAILSTEFTTKSTPDPYKTKILATINRHERMTNEILKKMDSHTQLLKNFIETLINANNVAINKKYNMVETKSTLDTNTQNMTTVRELATSTKNKNDNNFPKVYFYSEPTPNHGTEVTPLNDMGKYKMNHINVKKENNEKNDTNVTKANVQNYYNIGRSLVLKLPSTDYKSVRNKLPPGVTLVNTTKH